MKTGQLFLFAVVVDSSLCVVGTEERASFEHSRSGSTHVLVVYYFIKKNKERTLTSIRRLCFTQPLQKSPFSCGC